MNSATAEFIAVGGNRNPEAADWDCTHTKLLAFGAGRNVALWQPLHEDHHGIQNLLSGHSDVVNAVKFLHVPDCSTSLLLTGSADCSIRLWTSNDFFVDDIKCKLIPDAHKKSVNTIAILPDSSIFASGAADFDAKVWQVKIDSNGSGLHVELLQQINLAPKYFPLALALVRLPTTESVVLAVAGTKAIIQIYVASNPTDEFKLTATLAGHEGWIRSLSFVIENQDKSQDLILASASQDKYIRLWRIHRGKELPTVTEAVTDPALGSIGKSLSNKAHHFRTNDTDFTVTFEALLVGHEDWIYTVRWHTQANRVKLLSASADNSLAIWELDDLSGIWICTVRLGEISAQKGATTATGSTGGLWIGLWSPTGDAVVGLGRTGAWRKWNYEQLSDRWDQDVAVTGHTRDVQDLSWSKDGSYLLSTGSDQTTRLFAEWKRENLSTWHEFSRPQIHGYDLNCIDNINGSSFISGADEKLLRVFDEPKAVADLLRNLTGYQPHYNGKLLDAAQSPVLGLSNKAVEPVENGDTNIVEAEEVDGMQEKTDKLRISLEITPPLEDHLAKHLLWPETEKLYGHGHEISAVAASNDGEVVATACKASSLDHAVIRIYETKSWQEIKPSLVAHTLTITSMEFSSDDKYLLSVGRDRQCAVFRRSEGDITTYKLLTSNSKAHTRMILDCAWAPILGETRMFATAGRDKQVYCWNLNETSYELSQTLSFNAPVTAISFFPKTIKDALYLACGCEDGNLDLSIIYNASNAAKVSTTALCTSILKPSLAIAALAWRPIESQSDRSHELAVASHDSSVRILRLQLSDS